ncbi:transposase [Eubacterium sp. MSJ-13]|uniref:IS66 family insertion sequence element accessory protein TnpB n=1 Tax=Eubacterium sp. MSJ-13 TaxID=2841513 RepID=UPI001C1071D2|nr:IS66 family insertion sequence element accessory protein TnpB [Eubacterium sp. MSJ-13]MBU5477608.1 transposase [Eubacterium sp. MSJ-13]
MLGDISALDKIYMVCGRTDMRKQIDRLCSIIEEKLQMHSDENALFLFCGRKKTA